MTHSKWADWILRPWRWTLVSAASVCAVLYCVLLLMHWLFEPLLSYEQHHYALLLVDSAGLTLVVVASIYSIAFRMLRRNEELLRHVIARMSDAVIVADAHGRIIEWNLAAERLFRYARADALGEMAQRFLSSISGFAQSGGDITATIRPRERIPPGTVIEGALQRENGDRVPVEVTVSASPWQSERTTLYVVRDVSDRKAIESDLQESEQQVRLATEMAGIAIWTCDFESNRMLRSRNHDSLFGLPWQPGRDLDTFLRAAHPQDRERIKVIVQSSVQPRGPDEYSLDFRVVKPDGSTRWLWVKGRVTHRDANGRASFARGIMLDISDRKETESRLKRVTQLYAALGQCNQAMVRCSSEEELFPQICREVVAIEGLKMAAIGMVSGPERRFRHLAAFGTGIEYLEDIDITASADFPSGRGPAGTCIREGRPFWCQDYETDPATAPWRERGARFGWRSCAALPLLGKGQVLGAILVYSDMLNAFEDDAKALLVEMAADISFAIDRMINERLHRRLLADLRQSDEYLRTVFETEPECVKVVGEDGSLLDMNRAGLAMLELDSVEIARQKNLLDFVLPGYHAAFRDLHQRVMRGESGTLEFEMRGLKGTRRVLETHAAPMRDSNGAVQSLLGVTRDVTERKLAESRIQYLANFDALTGLPNRNVLSEHLKYAIGLARHGKETLCILFVDLDRFKDINDTLGHSRGDAFLVETGKRLRSVLRDNDIVSRHGGDEFVVMLPDSGTKAAVHVAEKLLAALSKPCLIDEHELRVTASIGIAIFPDDGRDSDTLFRSADAAMYLAKREGRNAYRFFTEEMQERAARHMTLTHAMHRALELGQFELHYQPQFSIRSGRIVGVEALLRWRHPELGDVAPAEFIPVAEYSGLILPLGEWALRTAVRQLKEWLLEGLPPIVMAVNLSAVQFRDRKLPELVADVLSETQLSPEFLELELTESAAMSDPQVAFSIMERLRKLGVHISIDDFGTGYSSFDYLKRFSIHKIKIDQSFVREIDSREQDRAIVRAIISVSKSLGLQTVAEGVESPAQRAFLADHGCDEVQGYLYCKPLSAAQFEAYLRTSPLREPS